eukprot:284819562_1
MQNLQRLSRYTTCKLWRCLTYYLVTVLRLSVAERAKQMNYKIQRLIYHQNQSRFLYLTQLGASGALEQIDANINHRPIYRSLLTRIALQGWVKEPAAPRRRFFDMQKQALTKHRRASNLFGGARIPGSPFGGALTRRFQSQDVDDDDKGDSTKSPPADMGGENLVSESVRNAIADVDVKIAVAMLKEGTFLLKYCHNSFRKVGAKTAVDADPYHAHVCIFCFPHQRLFWVDMETLTLRWVSPKKGPKRTQIFLTDVDRIVAGVDSDFWRVGSKFLASSRSS